MRGPPPLALAALLAAAACAVPEARAAISLFDLRLTTSGAICNPDTALVSCVRYGGDTGRFPEETVFRVEADFGAQVGDIVPLVFPDLFLPDPDVFPDPIEIEAPGEGNALVTVGTWDIGSGAVGVDLAPLAFPNVTGGGGIAISPFDLTTGALPALTCEQTIPPMTGTPVVGPPGSPGGVTLVGRACVSAPSLNAPVFVVLTGILDPVSLPGVCGDGVLNQGEECDDSNPAGGDGCSASCALEICGNGVVDVGETCDDGNLAAGDGCSAICGVEFCGNAVLDPGEQCDDGNATAGDGCSTLCAFEVCGNGVLDPGEQCDDANTTAGDGCSASCNAEVCGNGIPDPGEACDDGNLLVGDGCSATCTVEICGNGVVDFGESCDDGNTTAGDGCSASCSLEACGNGVLDPMEQCDDGNVEGGDGCSPICAAEICGNGVVDPGESCDDGGTDGGDGCSAACSSEICGNGRLDVGEACDDGNVVPGDGCSSLCNVERPDLEVMLVFGSPNLTPGSFASVTSRISNLGPVATAAHAIDVSFFLTRTNTVETSDTEIAVCSIAGLDPGGVADCSADEVPIASGIEPGAFRWAACADRDDQIAESDETNNCHVGVETLVPEASLAATTAGALLSLAWLWRLRRGRATRIQPGSARSALRTW